MEKLEGECALLELKIEEATAENQHLVSDIKRVNRTELPLPTPFARRNSQERVARCVEDLIVFLASNNIIALKEQLLFCVQKLKNDFPNNTSHFKCLINLENILKQRPMKQLLHESSLEDSLSKSEEPTQPMFINSSYNFVPAPTLYISHLSQNFLPDSKYRHYVKELTAGFPASLSLLLIIEYYCRLREGCLKKHGEFSNLHKKWGYGVRAIKEIKKGMNFLQGRKVHLTDSQTQTTFDSNPKIEGSVTYLEKLLEIIFRIKVFIQTFALRMHKLICRINSTCSKLRFPYRVDIVCPFLGLGESLVVACDHQGAEAQIHQARGKLYESNSQNANVEIDAWNWIKSRIRFFRLTGKTDLGVSVLNRQGSTGNSHNATFQQFYDQMVNDMRIFSTYVSEVISEAKGHEANVSAKAPVREADQPTGDFRRSITNTSGRREPRMRGAYNSFADNIPPLSLRSKVLIEHQSDY